MYNPTPTGKLGSKGTPRGTPVWQPLQPLKPIELQNAGFVQETFARTQKSHFALWTVEEQQAASKIAQAEAAQMADVSDDNANDSHASDPEGKPSSVSDPLSSIDPQTLEILKEEAFARGVDEGKRLAQAEAAAKAEADQAQSLSALAEKANQILVNIEQGVLALQEKPDEWHEPLKRLALHLAEQLTLTELSISSNGIQSLIDRCIETLDVQVAASLVVELNPNDMALLQNHKAVPGEPTHAWRMVADPHLLPGSVRVRADDAVVSDLIEHRLETLAQALLKNTKPWQAQTAFQPERLSARRGQADTVEDALPRETTAVNLDSLDLPDLDLPDLASETPPGASHD